MLLNVLSFELKYRATRPATYIYFAILLLLSFAGMAVEDIVVGGGVGQVKQNAPTVITTMTLLLGSIIGIFIVSAVMGVPVLRDFEHKTESMMFTTRMKKGPYLFGRFLGSFSVLLFISLGIPLGLMIGSVMPWLDADKFLPFNAWHFIQPYLFFLVPNMLFMGCLFFSFGALTRKLLFVYVQGIALLALWIVAGNLLRDLESKTIAALLDPFGLRTVSIFTQYWTIEEQNTQVVPLVGMIFQNRLIWVTVGVASLLLTYLAFNFNVVKGSLFKKRKASIRKTPAAEIAIPATTQKLGISTYIKQVVNLSGLYAREVVRSVPFIAITAIGIFILITNSLNMNQVYGTSALPTTYSMVELLNGFNLFFLIIIVFYSGELIWRERDLKMNQIYDTLPVPNFVGLSSKFLGMGFVLFVMLLLLMLVGVSIQASKGFFDIQFGVYLGYLYGETYPGLLSFTLLAFFIHVLANQKFLGHALIVIFFISTLVLDQLGLEHNLLQFNSGGLGRFSDMNTYGHYVPSFSWFQTYWFAFVGILFALAVSFSVRGTDLVLKTRVKLAKQRFTRPLLIFGLSTLILFVSSGFYIFYNTNILNEYRNSDQVEELRAAYEKTLKPLYGDAIQPKITETYLEVDVFPERRDFNTRGFFVLKNKSIQSISEILIQHPSDDQLEVTSLVFDREYVLDTTYEDFGFEVYKLTQPLTPGDSVVMNFACEFVTKGFVESGSNTNVVYNGTFFTNTYFPSLGYSRDQELSRKDDRKDQGLPAERDRMLDRDDPKGYTQNLIGDDADRIKFEIIMSTSADQVAIAPGYLQKEWEKDGRRYFHYKMDQPILNFYAMVSGRYEVMRDEIDSIKLEIYHHPAHTYNLESMMNSMKKSLAYFSENFSPYQYRQLRIIEFPRYRSFAQSFANTVPFSEAMGFVLDVGEDDVDFGFEVTAHEIAHQWWAHQVTEAKVKGNGMLSETMAQYSSLMVLKQEFGPEIMQKFLKYELDRYLSGRSRETKKEMPLAEEEQQSYIRYRKGAVVMYAFQDYISEDSVNIALSRCIEDWAYREDRYITTLELLNYFREVTPDSLQHIITDMFETITLYENRAESGTYTTTDEGKYLVNLETKCQKYRADSLGKESIIPINDWIDVGVYAKGSDSKDSLIYLQKHKVDQEEMTFSIEVETTPYKVGIDPINKLIDRTPKDNVVSVKEKDS